MSTDSTITDREQSIIDDFAVFDDWLGKYEYLIEQGSNIPVIEDRFKDEAHRVRGCQAQVWVHAELRDGLLFFSGDSDAQITKGLVALLIRVLSGQPPCEVSGAQLGFIEQIGLQEHLSPTRKNGLNGMIKQMKTTALQYCEAARN